MERKLLLKFALNLIDNLKSRGKGVASNRLFLLPLMLIVFSNAISACVRNEPAPQIETGATLSVSSTAFEEGDKIPARYTCDGEDISPPLAWDEPPGQTQEFAMIVDDPDAPSGTFTHWILFNIPANIRQLAEAVPAEERLGNSALQGKNDFGKVSYRGPCPPPGSVHHYRFTIYALDKSLDLKAGASGEQVANAIKGHVIARGQLMGTYQH